MNRAWRVVVLLMPVALLNYLDRQMLASMQESVMKSIPELRTAENPDELWGFMLGQFKWVYAVFSLFGGYIADRYSRRLTICGSLFVWSAVTCWTGQVTTYAELLWARSLMGISEAFYIPAALALIADHHAPATRSKAVGWHQTSIYLGVIIGGFGGYFAADPALGWRLAFTACGILGMAYVIPLTLLLKANAPTNQIVELNRHSPLQALKMLITNRSFLLLVLVFTLPAMAAWIVRDWMPSILRKQFNLGQGKAGVAATLYWQLAAIAGAALGGWLSDRDVKRHPRGRLRISALGMFLVAVSILGVGLAGSLTVAVIFLIAFGIGWGFFDGNNMPILSQIVSPKLRASGYGLMNFVSISFGGLADWGFGVLRDAQVPLAIIFSGFAMLAVLSIGLVFMIQPKPELLESSS